jgi:hypothetical protein
MLPYLHCATLFLHSVISSADKWGAVVSVHQPKRARIEIESLVDLPPQPCLALVSPNSRGSSIVHVLSKSAHLFGTSHVPSCLPVAVVATTVTTGDHPHRVPGMWSPHLRRPASEPSCGCAHVMRVCRVAYCSCGFCFSYFHPRT